MPHWRLYYHLVWATKNREPLIVSEIEAETHEQIRRKVCALKGDPLQVNGTADHVHLVTSIPPNISVSDFVGQVKGSSSFHINHLRDITHVLEWQRGYGAFSLGKRDLEPVLEYVRNQKERHSVGKVWSSLERMDEEEERIRAGMLREEQAGYFF